MQDQSEKAHIHARDRIQFERESEFSDRLVMPRLDRHVVGQMKVRYRITGVQLHGAHALCFRGGPIPLIKDVDGGQRIVRGSNGFVQLQSPHGVRFGFGK